MIKLKEEIFLAAEITGRKLSDITIAAYAEALSDLPEDDCIVAIRKARNSGKFPAIDDIRELVDPTIDPIDDAREVASLVVEAIAKYGWTNPREAKAHVGEIGWILVERMGGWVSLCENTMADNLGTLQAQFRDLAGSIIRRHQAGYGSTLPQLPQQPEIKKIASNLFKSIDETEFRKKATIKSLEVQEVRNKKNV